MNLFISKTFKYSFLLIIIAIISAIFIHRKNNTGQPAETIFTNEELAIINDTLQPLMKIYLIDSHPDSLVLRRKTTELTAAELQSPAYQTLCKRMIKTVTDSTVDGVGIAGPQVGISRRIVAVQRYDKEGFPFETYPNIYIKEYSGQTELGREGCLSVPDMSGKVKRSQWIIISYTNPNTLQIVQDTVKGFTARIFQHETDHLEGIVYTDRMEEPIQ